MPRIRTLKPEHKQHRKVGMLTDREYRLWVGMVTEADDDGRLVADAAFLRAVIFPYHGKLTVKQVADALQSIVDVGLVELYTVGNTRYAAFPSWRDHQKLDRAHYFPSKLPSPPLAARESMPSLPIDSRETRRSQGTEGNLKTKGSERREGSGEGTTDGLHVKESEEPTSEESVLMAAMGISLAELRRRQNDARARARA